MKYNHTTGMFYKSEDAPEILGETSSGKQVLGGDAESYSQDFNAEDHQEARKIHVNKVAKLQQRARMSMLSGGKFNHKLLSSLSNQAAHHSKQADWHEEQGSEDDSVEKGGVGSGRRGHTTYKPRPGQGVKITDSKYQGYHESVLGKDPEPSPKPKKQKEIPPPPDKTLHHDELPQDHYTRPNLKTYKKVLNKLGEKAHGKITYREHDDTIHSIGDEGHKFVRDLIGNKKDGKS